MGYNALLGVVEECGELCEALDNGSHGSTKDAIGDITVYLMDYCSQRDFTLQYPGEMPVTFYVPQDLMIQCGCLAHAHLKELQGIRGDPVKHQFDAQLAIVGIMHILYQVSRDRGWVLIDVIQEVVDHVTKRNWKADPLAGGAATTTPDNTV